MLRATGRRCEFKDLYLVEIRCLIPQHHVRKQCTPIFKYTRVTLKKEPSAKYSTPRKLFTHQIIIFSNLKPQPTLILLRCLSTLYPIVLPSSLSVAANYSYSIPLIPTLQTCRDHQPANSRSQTLYARSRLCRLNRAFPSLVEAYI